MTSPLSSASAASKMAARRDPDLEPDEQWKENLKAQIQLNLASMVKDAETQYKDNLEKNPADGDRLKMELAAAIDTIKKLATEEFKSQLERERSQRRWATGQELPPELAEDMKKEQQAIWDQIHSGKNSATSPTDDALATSPSDLRNSTSVQSSVSPSVNVFPPPRLSKPTPRATLPEPRPPSQEDTDEESDAAHNRNARSQPIIPPTKPRDDDVGFGRHSWESNSVNLDRVPRPYSSSTTPPKPTPEVFWIPPVSSEEIPASSRPQRRGSTASIRSTGSTSSRRPPIANTIPETTSTSDTDLAAKAEQERARIQDADQAWRKLDAAKDKEAGLGRRRTLDAARSPSTPTAPDPGTSPVASNLSSSPSQSRRPPTPPLNTKPIYRKPSFAQDSPSHSLYRQPSFTQDAGPRSARPNPSHLSLSRPPDMSFNGDSDSSYSQTPISATLALAQAAEGYPPAYAVSPLSYHRSPSPLHDPDFNMRTRSRNPSNEPRYPTAPFSAGPLSSHNTPFQQGEQAYPSPPPSHRGAYSSSRSSTQQQPPYSASPYSSSQSSQIHTAYSSRPSDDAESIHYSNGPSRSRSGMGNPHPDSHQQSNVRSSIASPDAWRSWSQQQHPRDLRSPMSTNSLREQHRQQPTRDKYHSPIYTDVLVDRPEGSGEDSETTTESGSEESSPKSPPQSNFSSNTSHSSNSVRPMNMKLNSKADIQRVPADVESLEYHQMQAKERKMQREASAAKAKRKEMEKQIAEEEENRAREASAAEESRRRKQEEEAARKREEEEARAKQRELDARVAREREIEAQRKKEDDTRRRNEALRRKEEKKEEERLKEDMRRRALEEEEAKLELAKEEARKEEARREKLRKEEDELRRREDEARKREDEIRRKEEELQRMMLEEKQREFQRLEQEARRKEEEAQTRERLARLREEEARRKEAEIQERERQLRVAEEELRRRERAAQEDARRRERAAQEEARRREEERAAQEAEELRLRQEQERVAQEERLREERAAREERLREERAAREERLRQEKAAAEEVMRQQRIAKEEQERLESEIAWRDHERRKAEEARTATRREEQAAIDRKKREDERNQIETDAKRREQEKRQEEERKRMEMDKMAQQKEFQRREEEIRNRKRQDSAASWETWTIPTSGSTSWGTSQPSPNPPTSGTIPNGGMSTPQRSNTTSSASGWSTKPPTGPTTPSTPGWSATPKSAASASASRTSSTSSSNPTPKTRTGSTGSSANPSFGAPLTEEQWHTRNEEQFRAQQERFRQEQERLERERMAKSGKVQGSKEEVIKTFEHHARLWEKLPEYTELRWDIFPWPMLNKPSSPEDITYNAIRTYVLSPHYPEKEKPQKDRIKEHIRRWHPDRFETKLLTKVIDADKERVREGAGSVVRSLNDLLTKSNTPSFFD